MDKLELTGCIVDNKINYDDEKWREKLEKFKFENEQKEILIRFEMVDTPAFYLHKYYRGYLLPDVAEAMGETSTDFVHFELKKMFLFQKIEGNTLKEVPSKYRSRCNYFIEERVNESGEIKQMLVGYTPSTGDVKHKEMQQFITQVEHLLFVDLSGCINQKHQEQAAEFRAKGMVGSHFEGREVDSGDENVLFES